MSRLITVTLFILATGFYQSASGAFCPPIMMKSESASTAKTTLGPKTSQKSISAACGGTVSAPGTPNSLTSPSSDSDGSFNVTWDASFGFGSVGYYQLYQSVNSGTYLKIASPSKKLKTFGLSNLANGTYRFRIRASNVNTSNGSLLCSG